MRLSSAPPRATLAGGMGPCGAATLRSSDLGLRSMLLTGSITHLRGWVLRPSRPWLGVSVLDMGKNKEFLGEIQGNCVREKSKQL